jgi:hypothetical protein
MADLITQSQISIAPTTRPGIFGRLWRRFFEGRMERVMYRLAPTRKM